MKTSRNILLIVCLLCSLPIAAQLDTLFSLSFEDPDKTPEASGSTTVKTLSTEYGDIKFLDISFHNASKIYHQIEIFGWIEFRSGSETINTTNSYIELPPITFANGGNFYINYGAGSTSRQLRLQEWNGSSWVNGTYDEVNADKTNASSTWYQKNWAIIGAGTKIFRLVMSSAPPMNVTEIVVTGNMGSIGVSCADTLNFGSANINDATVIRSFNVTGNYLISNISISPSLPYKVSTIENGAYYSSISIPPAGGTVYVKYQPTAIGQHICPLVLSSPGALNKTIILKGEGVVLSNEKQITSFVLNGAIGDIDDGDDDVNDDQTIDVILPSNTDLSIPYTPVISVSPKATLLTSGSVFFTSGVPITFTVQAEDGSLCDYLVTVYKLSDAKQITAFTVAGNVGEIDEANKIITVTVPSTVNLSLAYTPTVSVSAKASLLTMGAMYFDSGIPVTFTVQAEDGSLCNYQVTIIQLSDAKQITAFTVAGNIGVIDEANKTITVTVPSTVNLSLAYTPTVGVSAKASLLTTGAKYFTSGVPVTFTVQAEDGSLCSYQVTVIQLSGQNKITSFSLLGKVGIINDDDKTITITVPSTTNLTIPYTATVIVSDKATLLTTGAIYYVKDVPVVFTVRAEDGSLCDYQVTLKLATSELLNVADNIAIYATGGYVIINSLTPVAYEIFNLNAILLEKGTISIGKTSSVTSFTKGVYVVIIEGKSYKVHVK